MCRILDHLHRIFAFLYQNVITTQDIILTILATTVRVFKFPSYEYCCKGDLLSIVHGPGYYQDWIIMSVAYDAVRCNVGRKFLYIDKQWVCLKSGAISG